MDDDVLENVLRLTKLASLPTHLTNSLLPPADPGAAWQPRVAELDGQCANPRSAGGKLHPPEHHHSRGAAGHYRQRRLWLDALHVEGQSHPWPVQPTLFE